MSQPIRNIAVMAHADAGKTTLTEQFLFLAGQTKRPGNVDNGTALTDFLPVERERGISVRSAHISINWQDTRINLIDTPGHVDFSADVERVMRIVDGVILVISAVEGVQAHTGTLWNALRESHIPVLIFINKIDRVGADCVAVIHAIGKELGFSPFCLQELSGEGSGDASLRQTWKPGVMPESMIEQIVAGDEKLLGDYLDGKMPGFRELDKQLRLMVSRCEVYPLFYGSAKLGTGMTELLDAVADYLPPPEPGSRKELSALVYGIEHDRIMGKIAHVRVFSGRIDNREVVLNATQHAEEKVTQVRRLFAWKYEDTGFVEAGDIAGICGFGKVQVGDFLGTACEDIPGSAKMSMPLLTVQIKPADNRDYAALAAAMTQLAAEDPALELDWLREEGELHVKIMGWIQMEVLERILLDRFNLAAKFENPTVIYKETPSATAEGFVQYWMPKPCWAIMRFQIEPGERGSGVVYSSTVAVNDIQQKYQNEAARTIPAALKQGIKGWEVTDLKITLVAGEDHPVHSRAGDFAVATPMGVMNGLVMTGTTLLEPMIRFTIDAAEELLGAVAGDITRMRGSFETPSMDNGRFNLTGTVPLSTSIDFPVKLSSRSGGKAKISTRFCGYRECTDDQGVIRPYKGISPLDAAKYILKARKAIQ